jgi:hypothetical protein
VPPADIESQLYFHLGCPGWDCQSKALTLTDRTPPFVQGPLSRPRPTHGLGTVFLSPRPHQCWRCQGPGWGPQAHGKHVGCVVLVPRIPYHWIQSLGGRGRDEGRRAVAGAPGHTVAGIHLQGMGFETKPSILPKVPTCKLGLSLTRAPQRTQLWDWDSRPAPALVTAALPASVVTRKVSTTVAPD